MKNVNLSHNKTIPMTMAPIETEADGMRLLSLYLGEGLSAKDVVDMPVTAIQDLGRLLLWLADRKKEREDATR